MSETSSPATKDSESFFGRYESSIRLAFCGGGICFFYWFYGLLQEKILSQSELGATFVLVTQTLANIAVALVWQRVQGEIVTKKEDDKAQQDLANYKVHHFLMFWTSAAYVFAMAASNESLRFVSYPTATLAKSCKMIPNMIMGWAIERRQYDKLQWAAAISISFGIALFNLSRIQNQVEDDKSGTSADTYWKGMALLTISLCMDGFLGACQGLLKRTDDKEKIRPPTAVETMLLINVYALFFLVPMAIAGGQWMEGIRVLTQDADLRRSVAILNGVVSMGQIFIFLTLSWYSSLVCTTITTTRKFFTILFSVLHFGHRFSQWQWLAVGCVFSGLYMSIAANDKPQQTRSKQD